MNGSVKKLKTGQMTTIPAGGMNIHVYSTCDPIDDQVIILEKNKRAVAIELPCFKDSIAAVTEWLSAEGISVEAKMVSYHGAGSTFLPGVKTIMTDSSVAYNDHGEGKNLVTGFHKAFGEAFDESIPKADEVIGAGEHEIAGISLVIVPNADAYEVEIPSAKAVYMHMLGHDCHSIVAGPGHADAIIGNLRQYLSRGFEIFLSSHYTPENREDVEQKIAYLEDLKVIATGCTDAQGFIAKVEAKYPGYSGKNYLGMSGGFFFPQ